MFAHFIQIRFADKVLIACQHMIFFFVQFRWQFTSVYLSVKWVINFLIFLLKSLFLSSLTSSLSSLVCEISFEWHISALAFVQQAQQQQQHQQLSSCKCCTSMCLELTTCRVLVLYNTYIAVLVCVNVNVNSVLKID